MWTYAIRRVLHGIVTLAFVGTTTFFISLLAPGSPVDAMLGRHAVDPGARERVRQNLGLDQPIVTQFLSYAGKTLRGDLGTSFAYRDRQVAGIIGDHLPTTLILAGLALSVAFATGTILGLCAVFWHATWRDHGVSALTDLAVCTPQFVTGPVLVAILSVKLGWLPVAGLEGPSAWILPTLVLAVTPAAFIARYTRNTVLDELNAPYLRTARAKGITLAGIVVRHALRNATLPLLSVGATTVGAVVAGTFVVETMFAIPGIRHAAVQATLQRDYHVIQGVTLCFALVFVATNLAADLLYGVLDPRVRLDA